MNFSFKNRIAFYYMMATATIMAIAFSIVYFVVEATVLQQINNELAFEAEKHTQEVSIEGEKIKFVNKAEWEEFEHQEVQMNPVFIQIMNLSGEIMDKSPNLKEARLPFDVFRLNQHYNTILNNQPVRQAMLPLEKNGEKIGYIVAAVSLASSESVLVKLRNTLIISYLMLLSGLYFISRLLAGRSILPVQKITNSIQQITKRNLSEGVELPKNKDEIYTLASAFNGLLKRIREAMERERQFTGDASHELRTPLASIRGTLEVLIRKPRQQQEYIEKINLCLDEIDKISITLEQLMQLARAENTFSKNKAPNISISTLIDKSLTKYQQAIHDMKLDIQIHQMLSDIALVPAYYSSLIIENIISNAIKYSKEKSVITIELKENANHVICTVKDEGIGIKKEDIKHIFDSFYRSESLKHKTIPGNGLGLSIVKKSADAIGAILHLESDEGKGTSVTVRFLRNS